MPLWNKVKLADIMATANTGLDAIKRAPIVSHNTGIKCLRIQDVSQKKEFADWGFTEVTKENYERFSLNEGEIILARTGNTIGVNLFINKNFKSVFNNGLIRLRVDKQKCNSKYLYYNMQSNEYWSHIDSIAFGTSTQPNMQIESFLGYEIQLPDLPTQTRIASILSALDDKIELNRQMNHTLEMMAQALFKKYFITDMDNDKLPVGWRMGKFSDYVEVARGLSYNGAGLCNKGEGIPMHNLNSVYEGGGYKNEGIKYYKGEFKERHQIKPWDIIVTNTEQGHKFLLIGFPAIVPKYFGNSGIFTQHIYKLKLKSDEITTQYFYYLILQHTIREQIISCTNGTTVNMLSIDGLQKPDFIIPPKELLKKFSETVSSIWLKQEENYLEVETLTKLRDTLLPKLMSGEVSVEQTAAIA